MQILELVGRIFISLIFLLAGVRKIFNYEGTIGYMESYGIPGYLLIPAIVIEILFLSELRGLLSLHHCQYLKPVRCVTCCHKGHHGQ